jgi:hypothetical protein
MWIENLKDLKQVTHPESKQMYLDALSDLYKQAEHLFTQKDKHLDGITSAQLAHILWTPLVSHVALAKHSSPISDAINLR